MPQPIYDLIIIGAGPAGLTAAIYAGRKKLKTLVVAKSVGGQAALSNEIENYPGFDFISGFELTDKLHKQALKWGIEFKGEEVKEIKQNKDDFIVKTSAGEYEARAVILGFGLTPRDLNVPGEKELIGKGVTYCAICDGPFYKDKTVAVVGGGNSALEAVEYLSKIAKKVYLIHFSESFRADKHLVEIAQTLKNVEFMCCLAVKEIKGGDKVEFVVLNNVMNHTQGDEELALDGVFVEIGYQAKTDWLKGVVELNARHEIVINKSNETSVPGIFGAGDCTDVNYKQIVIAAGEGAKAALMAYKYLVAKTGGVIAPDWGKK